MVVLGIETSCDETAVALVNDQRQILAHYLKSQIALHQSYGGVVPEMAARDHLRCLRPLILEAMSKSEFDAVAVAAGPGLIGGVLVGVMMAKALAAACNKPFIAVNHLEAHALTVRLTTPVEFPYLLLLVSGGHSQFLVVHGIGHYELLGTTIDDALGEAFDKVARLLNLDYPGGPALEKLALQGNPSRFQFPRPLLGRSGCDFSFSGLKTAVRLQIDSLQQPTAQDYADIAASFQVTVGDCLIDRLQHAFDLTPTVENFVIAGGVAANQYLRERLQRLCHQYNKHFMAPPAALCTDNGAMIAWAGLERFQQGLLDSLDFTPRPRWPLTEVRYA